MRHTVLVYSGGLDSTALLYRLLNGDKDRVSCISFDYGQRHRKELDAARKITELAQVPHEVIDLRSITHLLKGSSQTDATVDVPLGRYDEPNMKLTVVPNRNMIMLSIAAAWAISQKAQQIAYAVHGGDHAIYPDCRDTFTQPLGRALLACDWHEVQLYTPFIYLDKGGCVTEGVKWGAPLQLAWSCYQGLERHCGKCGACTERREAYQTAGVQDPTEYAE